MARRKTGGNHFAGLEDPLRSEPMARQAELGGVAPESEAFKGTLSAFNPSPGSHYRAMTPLLAAMDFKDLAIGAAVGAVIAYFAGSVASSKEALNIRLLALQMRELQQKLDA